MTADERERSVERVIAEYLTAEDAGLSPDRAAILADHPELADDLRSFFREHDRFDRLAAPLREDPASTVDLAPAGPSPVGGGTSVPLPGRQFRYFGDYEILDELGRGGMGVVYRARQVSLNRPVALKMIRAAIFADSDDLRRFRNEVEAVALLDHPGVVPVYEVGEFEGQRYFSMKLIEGGGVGARLADYADDPRAAARLVAEAAEAVAHAHARGVLHRDLKPANLLIDAEGHPLVTDFGLAKRLTEDVGLTQTGTILGTPAYMSPEQAAGSRGTITTATDIYGLGAVLYALLTGRAPFAGEGLFETLDAVRTASPEGPRRLNPNVPRDLETICLKCLEKDPGRRYATARALADDLWAWLEDRPIAARPVGALGRAALFARRKPATAVALGLAATVVFLIGFVGTIARFWRVAETARAEAQAAHDRLASVEYGRAIQAAHEEIRDENVVGALALLDGTRPDLRGWEWHYVSALCHPELATFVGPKGRFEPYFDEDGTRIATLDGAGRLRFWDADKGTELPEPEGLAFDGLQALSPDGARIIAPADDGRSAVIRDRRSGSVLVTLRGHADFVDSAVFDPDGTRVVTASEDGTAKVWDAGTGELIRTLGIPSPSAVVHAVFSPDGTRIATAGEDRTARIWDASRGEELLTLRGHDQGLTRVEFRRDGARIVTASRDRTARVWDAASGEVLLTLRGHTRRVTSASFCRDGSRIVTASEDRTARIFDGTSGAALLTLCGHNAPVWSARFRPDGARVITAVAGKAEPARIWDASRGPGAFTLDAAADSARASFSPDGTRVAVTRWGNQSSESRILDARTGRLERSLQGASGSTIEFSRDGSRLVTAGADRVARIWDARSGEEIRALRGHEGFLTAASFSPDGSQVVTASVDGTARLWESRGGALLRELRGPEGRVNSAAFRPDGACVVTSGDDGVVRVWEAATGVERLAIDAHAGGASSAAFSPDGLRIATGGEDATAKVWDAATGAPLWTLRGLGGRVWSVAFSPDGSRLVTASSDGTVRLWDVRGGTEVLTLKQHADIVRTASFSPDGTRIVSGSDDGTVRIWDARPFSAIREEREGIEKIAEAGPPR